MGIWNWLIANLVGLFVGGILGWNFYVLLN